MVVEFKPDVRIAWRHRARHVWHWELVAVPEGTRVTESWDGRAKRGSTVPAGWCGWPTPTAPGGVSPTSTSESCWPPRH